MTTRFKLPLIPPSPRRRSWRGVVALAQWPHSVNLVLALNAARKLGVLPEETFAGTRGRQFPRHRAGHRPWCRLRPTARVRSGGLHLGGGHRRNLHFTARLACLGADGEPPARPGIPVFNRTLTIEGDTELGLPGQEALPRCPRVGRACRGGHAPTLPQKLNARARAPRRRNSPLLSTALQFLIGSARRKSLIWPARTPIREKNEAVAMYCLRLDL